MLPTDLLMHRRQGESLIPKYLAPNKQAIALAETLIDCFQRCQGEQKKVLQAELQEIEGDSTDFKVQRGLAHLLKNHFSTFEIVSPLEPQMLREKVFAQAAATMPIPEQQFKILEAIATELNKAPDQSVTPAAVATGLYADLPENHILTEFSAPTPQTLIDRYNLSQVQGIFLQSEPAHHPCPPQ